jgi:hypothetical protein
MKRTCALCFTDEGVDLTGHCKDCAEHPYGYDHNGAPVDVNYSGARYNKDGTMRALPGRRDYCY